MDFGVPGLRDPEILAAGQGQGRIAMRPYITPR